MFVTKQPNENIDQLIKRFKCAVSSDGILDELKDKKYFLTDREKKILKRKKRILHF